MNTYPQNALKILQLLLRCGMVCREELNVVLEMMPAAPDGSAGGREERAGAVRQCGQRAPDREAGTPPSRRQTLTFESIEFN